MKTALETNPLYTARAGVARYVRGLMGGLDRIGWPYVPLAWEVPNFGYRQPVRALKTAYRELMWPRTVLPGRLRNAGVELIHFTNEILAEPAGFSMPVVATLHDLAVVRHPERFRRWHRHAAGRRLRHLSQAWRVLCVSRFTADEAMQLLEIPASRLEVVHEGCDWVEASPAEAPYPGLIAEDYFLFVGSLEPGKNLRLLRYAYQRAEEAGVPLPPLVVVGVRWEGVGHEGDAPGDWQYCGYVSDEQLVFLMRRARALLYPSRYEGFGLPLLEAMAVGCPVLCGPVASLPEVGGDAVLYAALEPKSFLEGMLRLVREEDLRMHLRSRGAERVRQFTWSECARRTTDLYREAESA